MIVNGKEIKIDKQITISQLLDNLELSKDKVVVEVNYNIVQKEEFEREILNHTDKVEIVGFVGGG